MRLRNLNRPHAFEELRNEVEEKNSSKPAAIEAGSQEEFQELLYAARRHGLRWAERRVVMHNAQE